jgi:hypothetical protein
MKILTGYKLNKFSIYNLNNIQSYNFEIISKSINIINYVNKSNLFFMGSYIIFGFIITHFMHNNWLKSVDKLKINKFIKCSHFIATLILVGIIQYAIIQYWPLAFIILLKLIIEENKKQNNFII